MIPDPTGPLDEKVWAMRLTPKNSGPPAVVFSCACHPVIVYGHAFAAISADYPGAARKLVRESLGPRAHVQFVQGFAGDIRPRALADLDAGPLPQVQTGRSGSGRARPGRRGADRAQGSWPASLRWTSREPLTGHFYRGTRRRRANVTRRCGLTALADTNAYRLAVSDYWLKRYDTGEGLRAGMPGRWA